MSVFVSIIISAILTDNFVLSKFLGICPFLGVSKKLNTAMGMSISVTFVMVLSTAVTYPLQAYILTPLKLDYLQTVLFILIIASLVQLVETVLKKYIPALYNSLGVYLPLITTNCAVLGVTILNFTKSYTYVQSLVNSLGAGLGFMLAMFIFSAVRSRIETAPIPQFLKGLPITLIAAAIVSLSFLGFAGLSF
jgi:electron transport complex, RnfABCDGE type, A subunit